ncbi:MAG: DsrE family protein [Candidatus Heimdallarchaeota archaeon]
MIFTGSKGTDDPTMATFPFIMAKTAKEMQPDAEVTIGLMGEAVNCVRKGVAQHVVTVGHGTLKEFLDFAVEKNLPIMICGACADARGLKKEDCVGNVSWETPQTFLAYGADADSLMSF